MTFTPNSKVRLCSVPFSDYTNVLSFGTDDEARANYFISKTVYNLTDVNGYSYVRGNGAIRVNKNKESLYNVNYMMYRNDNFGSKWFYAFVDSLEYINANVTEIKFSTDVWQTWESALIFHESFIVRQHIPKSQDTIGANLQPEGFTNLRYVEEKRKRTDLRVDIGRTKRTAYIILATEWYDVATKTFKTPTTSTVDYTFNGLYLIPFSYDSISNKSFQYYIGYYANGSKADAIKAIYSVPIDFAVLSDGSIHFTDGIPLGYNPSSETLIPFNSSRQLYRMDKLTNIDIGTHGSQNIVSANNNKMFTFPFTQVILTNNNGSSITYRQEFFDGTSAEGNDIAFYVNYSPLLPVNGICYPANYREGDETNGLSTNGFPQCAWSGDTYSRWVSLNQNTLNYKEYSIPIKGALTAVSKGLDETMNLLSGNMNASDSTGFISNAILSGVKYADEINNFQNKKDDMKLQPNFSAGNYNCGNIVKKIDKLNFTVIFQRLSYEQFKQIDNYFDKFGYAINDYKTINYNNRSNFDYIQTAQVVIEGDVPEDDMKTIKTIFNNGVRIWHNTTNFLNFNVANN